MSTETPAEGQASAGQAAEEHATTSGAVPPVAEVSRLPLFIMGAVVVLAALMLIAVVAFRGPKTYDAGTPEAALQNYLVAVLDDRNEDAMYALLTPSAQSRCRDIYDGLGLTSYYSTGYRAELDDMTLDGDGDRAEARVVFRRSSQGDPFDNSSYSSEREFSLRRLDGDWLIDRAGWPYSYEDCTRP